MGMKEEVAGILLESRATDIDLANPFRYESGIVSPIYMDCRVLMSNPKEGEKITDFFVREIRNKIGEENIDLLAGVGEAGIPFASYLSNRLNKPMVFVRDAKKKHGKKKQIEGIVKEGQRVVLVCDIISTATTVFEGIEKLREAGTKVDYCIAVFDNNIKDTKKKITDMGVNLITLSDLQTLLTTGLIRSYITDEEKEDVEEWIKDPEGWNAKKKKEVDEKLEDYARKTAAILLEKEAIVLKPNDPFRFVSGVLSPIYTDCRVLISHHKEWKDVMTYLKEIIKHKVGVRKINTLAGTATAGIPHAAFLAQILNLPMVYVRSSKKEHGKENKVEGVINKGDEVVVIEDLISSGGSSLRTVEAIREIGGSVNNCVAIFNYGFPKSDPAFKEADVKLYTLCPLNTLLDVAVEKGHIKAEEKKLVEEWAKDPQAWTEKRDKK